MDGDADIDDSCGNAPGEVIGVEELDRVDVESVFCSWDMGALGWAFRR